MLCLKASLLLEGEICKLGALKRTCRTGVGISVRFRAGPRIKSAGLLAGFFGFAARWGHIFPHRSDQKGKQPTNEEDYRNCPNITVLQRLCVRTGIASSIQGEV